MTELGNSSEALSGVVMGKMAGSALAGQGDAESVTSIAAKMDGGALVPRVLQSQGVKYLFAVNGGHTWPILAALRDHGIKLIHMRHEQSCAYAADGWARTTATPGVCSVTAGCGLTNAVTASVPRASLAARWCALPASPPRRKTASPLLNTPISARGPPPL